MALRSKYVKSGKWRTLEWGWNTSFGCRFRYPVGAQIRVAYGPGFGSQRQTLDGYPKLLRVGGGSLFVARVQMKVSKSATVEYEYLAVDQF